MEAPGIWQVYPNADLARVQDLIHRLAEELEIDPPPVMGDTVALPADPESVVQALDKVEPDWREQALISPPPEPPDRG